MNKNGPECENQNDRINVTVPLIYILRRSNGHSVLYEPTEPIVALSGVDGHSVHGIRWCF
jgi:hypothetical protein